MLGGSIGPLLLNLWYSWRILCTVMYHLHLLSSYFIVNVGLNATEFRRNNWQLRSVPLWSRESYQLYKTGIHPFEECFWESRVFRGT
ncbi:hypothetical protein Nepgr_004496 [Nepenthes gracilis]|uniref:Uncharacterized protein n=1 Tax=Nepenthes gracilis TaxID=150966 RepID=A0AAD3S1H3_NEPGR|nr:hypothetical protein Nepgr_004496 [Nepenthes gracilis]